MTGAFDYVALIAQLVPGVAALLIALYALSISRRQTELQAEQTRILNRQVSLEASRLHHELFDRRFEIMKACQEFVLAVLRGNADDDARLEFEIRTASAPFLIDPSFRGYLKELRDNSLQLEYLKQDYSPDLPRQLLGENVEAHRLRHDWFRAQLDEIETRFTPYLSVSRDPR